MQWITVSSLVSTLTVAVLGLVCWHWLESGENISTGAQMAWQDARVATSCRSLSVTLRFIGRKYEDYQEDARLFSAPNWKEFICNIYDTDAERTPAYRVALIQGVYEKLSDESKNHLKNWLDARNLVYEKWKDGQLTDQ